ncbi:3-hydroxyacyl-ACP dehydratase FabZ family protein [Streptomyces sp. XD-27]|uniref:3-hydroxyacyl-ACP dehydratase FabZ family protein n=1 Tax=Streptomyces sp. XD-27 TaxID=3062779 RepID=UPI0026F44ECE|nr:3-hydroxyacyl-ACP dehydratase [Streptomyces sp. XD-27]WKX74226.1 3-hydroxyacyl-ACP dehydratase [Streptomyces sp. XD-27]
MPARGCGPVDGTPEVTDPGATGGPARTVVLVDPAERVFAGHYPGFPIFPGVCVIEYARLSALATLPEPGDRWTLAAIESTRFLSPVLPGDTLTTELTWARAEDGDAWRCRAAVSTERGRSAQVRLRFAPREDR